jgi:hypothetical protein
MANLLTKEIGIRRRYKKAIEALLIMTFGASILYAGYIHTAYLASMPRIPQPDTGRVYEVDLKVPVYVNRDEFGRANFALKTVPIIGGCCFLALVAIKQYWDK